MAANRSLGRARGRGLRNTSGQSVSIEQSRITMVTALFYDLLREEMITIPKITELRDRAWPT